MVAELARVTVTWGRAAPEGSVTAPAKAPVVADWQWEGEGQAAARSRVATNSLRGTGGIGKRIVTRERRGQGVGTRIGLGSITQCRGRRALVQPSQTLT